MTVKIVDGKATIPLWAAVTVVVSLLVGTAGAVSAVTERANTAAHEAITHRVETVEKVVSAIPEMQKDIAVIAALLREEKKKGGDR